MPSRNVSDILKRDDEDLLRLIVRTAENLLADVLDSKNRWKLHFEPETKAILDRGWEGFRDASRKVLNRLRNIPAALWRKLDDAGLTGVQLRMKWELLWADLKSGWLGRIFKRIDSLLKSLAAAIHLGELLKEYKEQVEISLQNLEAAKVSDVTSLVPLD